MHGQTRGITKVKRPRSPAYPGIDIESAVEKAQAIYERERGQHYIDVSAAIHNMGYSQKSGSGLVALSALIKFGLLSDRGSKEAREVALTELAMKVLEPQTGDEEMQARKEAALLPPIHRDLWDYYKGKLPPADNSIRSHLIRNKNFNPSSVDAFIGQFRRTIEYAGLSESDIISEGEEDKILEQNTKRQTNIFDFFFPNPFGESKDEMATPTTEVKEDAEKLKQQPRMQIMRLPVGYGRWANIQVPDPMTEVEWQRFMKGLSIAKPGVVPGVEPRQFVPSQIVTPAESDVRNSVLTLEAQEVIDKVDNGAVPLHMTDNLKRIARENGIEVSSEDTPNEIIEALRALDE